MGDQYVGEIAGGVASDSIAFLWFVGVDDYYACVDAVGDLLPIPFDGVLVRDLEEGVQGQTDVYVGAGERGRA